jgi:hypothetical protein
MSPGSDDDLSASDVEEGPVLSPEELDISDDERVKELDDGRYVVSSGDPITDAGTDSSGAIESGTDRPAAELEGETESEPEPTPRPEPESDRRSEPDPTPEPEPAEISQRDVHEWLSDDLSAANSRYGFDITASFDGSVSQQRMVSNDVVTIFETLVMWYAQQIDRNTPVEEVLGLLLVEANVPVRYPMASLKRTLQAEDLSPDDSIAELLRVVNENDGLEM